MAAPILNWTLNTERGSISFGRLLPFAGNTYDFTLAGTVYGQTYTAYLMSDDGLKCLAKSKYANGVYSIALNTADLRDEFVRDPHEVKTFHMFVRDTEKCVAEGDLSVVWNPLWEDTETGEVYTMRGPEGRRGEPGKPGSTGRTGMSAYELAQLLGYTGSQEEWIESLRGQPGNTIMVRARNASGTPLDYWHQVYARQNYLGEWVLALDQTPVEYDPDTNDYVLRTGPQTVDGVKTFTASPIVPTIETEDESEDAEEGATVIDTDDDSTKAANTKWVTAKLTAWWTAIKASAISIAGLWTFKGLVVNDDESTPVFAVNPENGKTSASKLDVTGDAEIGGDTVLGGDVRIEGELDFGEGVFDLFETKWLDYAKADSGKWRKYNASGFAKTTFPAAYTHLKDDYDNGTAGTELVSETIGGKFCNAIKVENGIATGFYGQNFWYGSIYAADTFSPQTTPWMLQLKIKTPAEAPANNIHFFGQANRAVILLKPDLHMAIYLGQGSSWNLASNVPSTNALSTNTWYWIRLVFDGSKYVLQKSADGITYIDEIIVATGAGIAACDALALVGYNEANCYQFLGGACDLRESRLVIDPGGDNESVFWEGSTRTYLSYKLASDGHRIVDIANSATLDALYAAKGVAWYWMLDTTNEKFYLPRTTKGFAAANGGAVGADFTEEKPVAVGAVDYSTGVAKAASTTFVVEEDGWCNFLASTGYSYTSYTPMINGITIDFNTYYDGSINGFVPVRKGDYVWSNIAFAYYKTLKRAEPAGTKQNLYFYLGR